MVLYPNIFLSIKLSELSNDHEVNRNELRKKVLDEFVKERAGTGTGDDTAKYKYYVETIFNGDRIYLTRPVPLNKGFDFIIHVEDHVFLNHKDNPKHDDLLEDLIFKRDHFNADFNLLIEALERVYLCEDPDDILLEYNFTFGDSLPADLLLKVCKWFFIEQDIRYWNWSGRNMLMNGIRQI